MQFWGTSPWNFFRKVTVSPASKSPRVRPSVARGRAYGPAGTGAASPPARLVSFADGEGGGAKGRESDG